MRQKSRMLLSAWLRRALVLSVAVLLPVLGLSGRAGASAAAPQAPAGATVPGAPAITGVVAGEASATVSWKPPSSDGGSPITSYVISSSPHTKAARVAGAYLTATVSGLTDGTAYTFTVAAANAVGTGPASAPSAAVTPHHPGAQYITLPTYRICDTRPGNPSGLSGTNAQCNGTNNQGTTLGPGAQIQIQVTGTNPSGQSAGGIPATGAQAALLAVTAVDTTAAGSLTAWPAGTARPAAPSLRWTAGAADEDQLFVPVGTNGMVSIYNSAGAADILVDVEGYTSPSATSTAGLYEQLSPYRVCDTRPGNPSKLSGNDAQCNGTNNAGSTLGAGGSTEVQVAGTSPSGQSANGVPATGVSAVILDVTALNTTAGSQLTVWPSGSAQPQAWNLSWSSGQVVQKRLVVPLGSGGQYVSVYNAAGSADVTIDVAGYFTDGSDAKATGSYFAALAAAPICDTAPGNPLGLTGAAAQCNGTNGAGRTLGAKGTLTVKAAGVGGIPRETGSAPPTAAALLVTAENTTAASSLSVYPAQAARPALADLTWAAGAVTENLVIVPLGTGGQISLYNASGKADVVVQALGFESGGIFVPASTVPLSSASVAALTSMTTNISTGVSTLQFSSAPAQVSQLTPGQVINAPPTAAAPNGILQKVTGVTTSGGTTTVTAVPAKVSDALTQGTLTYAAPAANYASGLAKAFAAQAARRTPGLRIRTSGGGLNVTTPCGSAGGSVMLTSQVSDFSLTPNVNFGWSPLANFSADASMRTDLAYSHSFSVSGTVSCQKSVPVVPDTALGSAIPLAIGPVDFTLTPVGSVGLQLAATGKASLTTSKATTAFYQQAGVHYDTTNGWNTTHGSGCDNPVPAGTPGCTTNSTAPSPGASLTFSAGLKFQLTLAVDYVPGVSTIGPFAAIIPALQLTLQPQAPSRQVNVNLQLQVGVQFKVWTLSLNAFWDLANDTWTVFHSVAQTTPANLPPAVATSRYSQQLTADGGQGPYTWSFPAGSSPPAWLALSASGALSGTPPPAAAGTSASFPVTVTDATGDSATLTDTLAVGPPVSLVTTSLPEGVVGQYFYYSLSATGGAFPYSYTVTGLPSWLSLDQSTGILSGTVQGPPGTTYPLSVTVTDSTSPATSDGPHTINLVIASFGVATATLPAAAIGLPYSATLSAAGGTAPYTWSFAPGSNPPAWLSLSADGTLSGTPPSTARGTSASITVEAADSASPANQTDPATLVLQVSPWTTTSLSNTDSVSCVSASFCMAVGSTGGSLAAHSWDGTGWTQIPVPFPAGAGPDTNLREVNCLSATFCMAVGWAGYQSTPGCPNRPCDLPLTERWNGTAWTIVADPPGLSALNAQDGSLDLYWVQCTSLTFCMATGNAGGYPYAEQWDGRQWFTVPIPNPGGTSNVAGTYPNGVSCTSPQFCVTVGATNYPSFGMTLAEQWNGYKWSIVPSPSPLGGNDLWDVSCATAASCLATGAPIEEWNGTKWLDAGYVPDLTGALVSCPASTDCFAAEIGAAQWNGSFWTAQPVPGRYADISCADPAFCVAVGGPGAAIYH